LLIAAGPRRSQHGAENRYFGFVCFGIGADRGGLTLGIGTFIFECGRTWPSSILGLLESSLGFLGNCSMAILLC
jgi:hypothetical protein